MAAVDRPPLRGPSSPIRVVAVDGAQTRRRSDRLAGEEPLEIRVSGPGQPTVQVAVTMRTPGHDFELAAGFLATEGLLTARDEIESIRYCADVERAEQQYNVLTVELRRPFDASRLQRNFYATSSCGVCGKASIDDVVLRFPAVRSALRVDRAQLDQLPGRLGSGQGAFASSVAKNASQSANRSSRPNALA